VAVIGGGPDPVDRPAAAGWNRMHVIIK
jgi:hypothetical protein